MFVGVFNIYIKYSCALFTVSADSHQLEYECQSSSRFSVTSFIHGYSRTHARFVFRNWTSLNLRCPKLSSLTASVTTPLAFHRFGICSRCCSIFKVQSRYFVTAATSSKSSPSLVSCKTLESFALPLNSGFFVEIRRPQRTALLYYHTAPLLSSTFFRLF